MRSITESLPLVARVDLLDNQGAMTWTSNPSEAADATVYDVLRGSQDELPVGTGAVDICAQPGVAGLSWTDPTMPAPGQACTTRYGHGMRLDRAPVVSTRSVSTRYTGGSFPPTQVVNVGSRLFARQDADLVAIDSASGKLA